MARELSIRITGDNSDFKTAAGDTEQAISGLEGKAKTSEASFRKLGAAIGSAFSLQALGRMAGQISQATGEIDDLSKKMGIAASATQELRFAAEQNGNSIAQVSNALALMGDKLVEGKGGAVAALERLGLSFEQVRALAPDKAFEAIGQALTGVTDPLERSNLAMELFGRSGSALLPTLTSDISALREQAREMGIVMSDDLVKAGDHLGDSWEAMQGRVQTAKAQALLPVFDLFTKLPQPIQTVIGIVSEFSGVLSGIALAVMAAGGPVAAFTAIGSALGTLGTAIAAIVTGPIGLLVAAVAGLTLVWVTWGDDISRIVKDTYTVIKTWLWDKLEPVLTPIIGLLKAIGDMFVAFGQLVGAVVLKVIDLHRQMVTAVIGWLVDKLQPIFKPLGVVIEALAGVFASMYRAVADTVQKLYTAVKTWLLDRFTSIVSGIQDKIEAVTGFFKKMHDAVVGHSWVPDMVRGIGAWFEQLQPVMVAPAQQATAEVSAAFNGMATTSVGAVTGLVTQSQTLFESMWSSLTGTGRRISDDTQGSFWSMAAGMVGAVRSAYEQTGDLARAIGDSFLDMGTRVLASVADFFIPGLGQLVMALAPELKKALEWVWNGLKSLFGKIWDGIKSIGKGIGGFFKGLFGGGDRPPIDMTDPRNWDLPPDPGLGPYGGDEAIPLAAGGIVRRPTLALVGEAGPEAVVPLDRWSGGRGSTITIDARGAFFPTRESLQQLADHIVRYLPDAATVYVSR